jgi:hypothetical protein
MSNEENIRLVVEAIEAVKEQIKVSYREHNVLNIVLMQDLIALENCLVTEVKKGLRAA